MNKTRTLQLLVTFAYLKCHNAQDVQSFFQLLYPALPSDLFTEDDVQEFETVFQNRQLTPEEAPDYVEQMVYWLVRRKAASLSFLHPRLQYVTHDGKSVPLCVEGALQTIINVMLYDPETKILSQAFLSPSLTVQEDFKKYLTDHNNPHVGDYFTKALPDWLQLVSKIPGVIYRNNNQDGGLEIDATTINMLTTLNYLFGTTATTFSEFGKQCSSATRTFAFTNPLPQSVFKQRYETTDDDDEDLYDVLAPEKDDLDSAQSGSETYSNESESDESDSTSGNSSDSDASSESDAETKEKECICLTVESPAYTPSLFISADTEENHAQTFFRGIGSSVPSLNVFHNLHLIGSLINEDLMALFGINWYKTIVKFFKDHVFATGPQLTAFLHKYQVLPAHVAAPSSDDDYLLEDALQLGREDLVTALLDYGVPVDHFPDSEYPDETPIKSAILWKSPAIIKFLLAKGALLTPEMINALEIQTQMRLLDYQIWDNSDAALSVAALLLEHGADPNLLDATGNSYLISAYYANNPKLFELLLQHGADPNLPSATGDTLLNVLISGKKPDFLPLALTHGADPNKIVDRHGCSSPLHNAVIMQNEGAIQLLLAHGANPNQLTRNHDGTETTRTIKEYVTTWFPHLLHYFEEKTEDTRTKG